MIHGQRQGLDWLGRRQERRRSAAASFKVGADQVAEGRTGRAALAQDGAAQGLAPSLQLKAMVVERTVRLRRRAGARRSHTNQPRLAHEINTEPFMSNDHGAPALLCRGQYEAGVGLT